MAHKTKKQFIIFIIILVAVAAVLFVGLNQRVLNTPVTPATASGTATTAHKLDLTPAKKSDNAANEQRKNSAQGASDNTTLTSPTITPKFSTSVSRVNTQAQTITAAATVNGVTAGTCIFTFSHSKDGPTLVASTSEAIQPSNQSAICAPITTTMPDADPWYVHVSVTNQGITVSAEWVNNPVSL